MLRLDGKEDDHVACHENRWSGDMLEGQGTSLLC